MARGAGHHDAVGALTDRDLERAARQADFDGLLADRATRLDGRHGRCACAGAARARPACAAFVDVQLHRCGSSALEHAREADIGFLRKERVALEQRPEARARGVGHIEEHHVRVAHGHRRHADGSRSCLQRRVDRRSLAEHGHLRGLEARRAHRDAHLRAGVLEGQHRGRVGARVGLEVDAPADLEAPGAREVQGHAAQAVAAHLGAAPIGVDHPHGEALVRALHEEHAVGAHPAVSVAHRDDLVRRERRGREVDHDEVVAEAFVFLERDPAHRGVVTCGASLGNPPPGRMQRGPASCEDGRLMSSREVLVGRERELEAFTRAVEGGARLLTVTGPGGVGKTRLVREGLARLVESHADMVPALECALGETSTLEGLVDRVVDALGGSGARRKDLTHLFAQRAPVVVVLDPFDRLVEHAGVLSEWLRAVPALAFVAVTRQVLRVPEEVVLEVGAITDEPTAIALFEAVAARHRPGFVLGEADRVAAAAIVKELDGLPLAIELAAARMAVMSPPALLHRLRNRFEVLKRGGAEGARHHALEASIAWSVELLGPAAREALAQCTVFRGGFTIEAAEAVVQTGAGTASDALDVLQSLRERSLLSVTEPSEIGELRLGLGQSVRAFVEASLAEPTREAAEERHARHYVERAEAWAKDASQIGGWRARAAIAAERDNLLAVVERILGRPNVSSRSADRALRALVALGPVLLREGALEITRSHLERGLAVAQGSGADPRLQARALLLRAEVKTRVLEIEGAERDLAEAMVLAHHTDQLEVEGRALVLAARLATSRREPERATAALDHAEAIARERRDEALAIACLGARGSLLLHARDLAGAELHFEEGLARSRRAADPAGEIAFCRRLAYLELASDRISPARERLEHARALAAREHERRGEILLAAPLALALALEGGAGDRFSGAVGVLEEATRRAGESGLAAFEPAARGLLGILHAARGERGEARLLLGEVTSDGGRGASALVADLEITFLVALARMESHANRRDAARKLVVRAQARADAAIDGALVAFLADDPLALDSAHRSPLVSLALLVPASAMPLGSVPPPADARPVLALGPAASWFRVAQEPRVDLSRRRPLRLVLDRLARPTGKAHLSWDDLLAAGWPGEKMRADAGAHRVRVAISTLRKMGLRDVLRTEEAGYCIDPGYDVQRSD